MVKCLFVLIGLCSPSRSQVALNVATAAASFADQYRTQQLLGGKTQELNPFVGPLVSHGKPLAFAATGAENMGLAYLAYRFKRSQDFRRLWWIPQLFAVAGHGVAITVSKRAD